MGDEFTELDQALERAGAPMTAAEAHGMLCGIICSGGQANAPSWQDEVLGGTDPQNLLVVETTALLGKLARRTLVDFDSDEFVLQPMLPGDGAGLTQRTTALARWCQGFYLGLSLGGVTDFEALPEDSREFIQDITDIAQLEGDGELSGEEDEAAYAEVLEYVRMGVLLVREEMRVKK